LPEDVADFETLRRLGGTSCLTTWKPIRVQVLRVNELGDVRRPADLPWLGAHLLVLSPRAVDVLGERLRPYGELLPLSCPDNEYVVFNPLRIVSALDEEASGLIRFPSSGRVMNIARHVFRPSALDGAQIFKIPQLRSSMYLTSEAANAIGAFGLQGTELRHEWSETPEQT
jgi:hypothetical protein